MSIEDLSKAREQGDEEKVEKAKKEVREAEEKVEKVKMQVRKAEEYVELAQKKFREAEEKVEKVEKEVRKAEEHEELMKESEWTQEAFVNVFEWHPSQQSWQAKGIRPARTVDSVVLDEGVKEWLLSDIWEYMIDESRWFKENGYMFKRGYLFYGVPGSGKTSMIQAFAGHFKLDLCPVDLTHPNLTDESLRDAVYQSPRKSVLIFEDIDTIFGRDGEKLLNDSLLKFSGLLNALDGIGNHQIFVLTTNHRERLNPALIQEWRADEHIEFAHATDHQILGIVHSVHSFGSFWALNRLQIDSKRLFV